MATKKNATKVAAGFPAKSAPSKTVEFDEAKHMEREAAKAAKAKKPTRAKKAVATPAMAAAGITPKMLGKSAGKAATKPARPPAVLAKSGKLLAADPKGVPGTKAVPASKAKPALKNSRVRTVAVPENGIAGVPVHEVTSVAELAKVLADFPRGSTFTADQYFGKARIQIYNLRGKLVAEVRQIAKPAKVAKK